MDHLSVPISRFHAWPKASCNSLVDSTNGLAIVHVFRLFSASLFEIFFRGWSLSSTVVKVIRPKNFDENIRWQRGILKVSSVLLANKDRREGNTKLYRHLSRGARHGMAKREEALWRHIGWSVVPLASHLAGDVRHARFVLYVISIHSISRWIDFVRLPLGDRGPPANRS